MKMKKYVKPELFFESYELSQNIAACGWDMIEKDALDPRSCHAVGDPSHGNPPIIVLADHCENVLEGYCYENSADSGGAMRVFNS